MADTDSVDKKKLFQMGLTNLRDDFMSGRQTQVYKDAELLFEAWKDLSDQDKKNCQIEKTVIMLRLFIGNLPNIGSTEFTKQYRLAFPAEFEYLDDGLDADSKKACGTLEIFQKILEEIKAVSKC